ALVIVRWSVAPGTTVNVVVSSVRLPLWAVRVIEPASVPVTVSVATPLAAVAAPSPATVPAPLVLVNVTLVALSLVRRLPLAARPSARISRVGPRQRCVGG